MNTMTFMQLLYSLQFDLSVVRRSEVVQASIRVARSLLQGVNHILNWYGQTMSFRLVAILRLIDPKHIERGTKPVPLTRAEARV